MLKRNNYEFVYNGGKTTSFLSSCTKNNLKLLNVKKIDGGLAFELIEKDYKLFKKLDFSSYDIKMLNIGGFKQLLNILIYRIGLAIGLIICMVAMFFLNNRIFQIHIIGLSKTSLEDVKLELKENGLNYFSKMNVDFTEIEGKLSNKFGFSLVSIISKGNSLIINVKEALPDIVDRYVPITADQNMIIKDIKVYSGTPMVKRGDIVHKGAVLVDPFVEKNGDKVYVEPCADIVARTFISSSYKFLTFEEKLFPTGNKQLIASSMSLGRWEINKSNEDCKYEHFETKEIEGQISKYILPIYIKKTYAIELEPREVERNFDNEKDAIINNLKNSVYSQVGVNRVVDENTEIIEIENGYIVNYHVECEVRLKYDSYN